jgi:meso-butanediol dehydrogenase / (S,S)-butanediol dehydrogenase / diacetyl reductase
MDFHGKTAIVTGAGSGIGRATALRLAALGASLTAADKNLAAAEETAGLAGKQAVATCTDVSSSADVQKMVAATVEAFGRLDILVNNAGYGFRGTVETISEADWDRLMAVNTKSVFLCSKFALPELVKTSGAIVNVTSYTAQVGIPDRAAYVASKGAIAALTRAMAVDHIGQGVRVNAVAPGTVNSPYFSRMLAESDNAEQLRASLDGRAPIGRMAEPEEIADAIAWLAGSESRFAVGTVLTVDGGTSIWGR